MRSQKPYKTEVHCIRYAFSDGFDRERPRRPLPAARLRSFFGRAYGSAFSGEAAVEFPSLSWEYVSKELHRQYF